MKKIVAVIIVFVSLLFPTSLLCLADEGFPDAAETPAFRLSVQLFETKNAFADVLELPGYPDAPFYLFLPADCNREKLIPFFEEEWMKIDGKPIVSGEASDVFLQDGAYTVETPNGEHPLNVISSETIPSVYISTESGGLNAVHADKSHKEKATLTAVENGSVALDGVQLSYIKGRGNTSWRANEKRSYNIKFSEKTDLFGMGSAKKWVLTSNNTDCTLMRNAIAYSAAQLTRLPYTVDFRFVDLYINGVYRGNYMLCEKIEIGEGRLDIGDLEKENKRSNRDIQITEALREQGKLGGTTAAWLALPRDPEDISGGYLMEYEYPEEMENEPCAFLTHTGQSILLHSPDNATENEMAYITELYDAFEEALLAENGVNRQGKHFTEYIDTDSFTDALLLYELTENSDRGHTSWYIFVPRGEQKIYMGPMWDFDSGMYTPDEDLRCIDSYAAAAVNGIGKEDDITFLDLLCSHRSVLDAMAGRFESLSKTFETALTDHVAALFAEISTSAEMDRIRWGYSVGQSADLALPEYVPHRIQHMKSNFAEMDMLLAARMNDVKTAKSAAAWKRLLPVSVGALFCAVSGTASLLILKKRRSAKTRTRSG